MAEHRTDDVVTNHREKILLDEAGGEKGVAKIVNNFYETVLADSRVAHFFEKGKDGRPLNAKALRVKMTKTLMFVLGDPKHKFYITDNGKRRAVTLTEALENLEKVHEHLPISDLQYTIIGQTLMLALHRYNTPRDVTATVAEILIVAEPYIVKPELRSSVPITAEVFFDSRPLKA